MKRFLLLLLVNCVILSSTAEESAAQSADETMSEPHVMMRHVPTVAGYQALSVAGQEIDATFIDDKTGERVGAVILFHDRGDTYDNSGVIHSLRHALPEFGWATMTLALDMPITHHIVLSPTPATDEGDTETEEAIPSDKTEQSALPAVANLMRIEAALSALQAKNIKQVVFIGQGEGAKEAIAMLSSQTLPVAGLIFIGLSDVAPALIQGIEIPILDIYGTQAPSAIDAVTQRKAVMAREGKTDYAAREIMGADHRFYGASELVIMTVRAWLRRHYQQ